jgi:hypothetical protein
MLELSRKVRQSEKSALLTACVDVEVLSSVEYSMSQNSQQEVNVLLKERYALAHPGGSSERNRRYPEEVYAWSTA